MPSQMCSKDNFQGKKIEAAQQYACWLMLHKENTFCVCNRNSSSHLYQRSSKKRMPQHYHCQLEQVFRPFLAHLGICTLGRGWEKFTPTSENTSAGWATCYACTSATHRSYKTCTVRHFDHRCKRSLTFSRLNLKMHTSNIR